MSDRWKHAARHWAQMGHPLRPGTADLRVITTWLADPEFRASALRAIVLGATPEYHALPWPLNTQVMAIDRSATMLQAIWPGPTSLRADWLNLPLAAAAVDLALCDGGLALQAWPLEQHALVTSMLRILRPGGLLILRCFVPPPIRESVESIRDDVRAGRHVNHNLVRLRLWMALQESPEKGVNNRTAWRALAAFEPRIETLASLLQVDADYLRAAVTDADERMFHFADLATIVAMFCQAPGGFRLEEQHVADYPFAALCPTLVLRRI